MTHQGQRRSLGPPPRWVVPIGASAGGIPPSLAAIFSHPPSWALVAIALGAPLVGAASYVIIAWADRSTVRATESLRASRERSVEEARRATLRACLDRTDAAVAIECVDREGCRWAVNVEAAARLPRRATC